jgi:hypothetical protein
VLHLEQSFVWCRNLGTSETTLEMLEKFWNVVLEKAGNQLERSCEELIITECIGGGAELGT